MKCKKCGSDVSRGTRYCEYCGEETGEASFRAEQPDERAKNAAYDGAVTANAQGNSVEGNQTSVEIAQPGDDSFWPSISHPIFHVWHKPFGDSFSWLAFLFPIPYLAGFGSKAAAIGLAIVFIVIGGGTDLLATMLPFKWRHFGDIANLALIVFYSAKVACVSDELAPPGRPFLWGRAIGIFLFCLVLFVLAAWLSLLIGIRQV